MAVKNNHWKGINLTWEVINKGGGIYESNILKILKTIIVFKLLYEDIMRLNLWMEAHKHSLNGEIKVFNRLNYHQEKTGTT